MTFNACVQLHYIQLTHLLTQPLTHSLTWRTAPHFTEALPIHTQQLGPHKEKKVGKGVIESSLAIPDYGPD